MEELLFYLHYSMFLFKLEVKETLNHKTEIYITICFYLNFAFFFLSFLLSFIYITVCFYLNYEGFKANHKYIKFTLQYVSI